MATVELTAENFESAVSGEGLVLIDFWAAWCGPCRMFGPVFERVSGQHADAVFGKVDTEAQPELAAAFGISSIPTLMVIRDKRGAVRAAGRAAGAGAGTTDRPRPGRSTWTRCARPSPSPPRHNGAPAMEPGTGTACGIMTTCAHRAGAT